MDSSIVTTIIEKLLTIPAVLFALSLRGYSEAFVAKKLGDLTPENNGQLTMNPMAHIDIFGFICIVLFGIGWGKPVITDSRNYKNVKRDKAFQILSGPVGLILGAFVMSLPAVILDYVYYVVNNDVTYYLWQVFAAVPYVCLCLAIFYLMPLPGLDGFNFIVNFLPPSANEVVYKIKRYSLIIFIVFILLIDYTPLKYIIYIPVNFFNSVFSYVWSLPVGFIFSLFIK